MVSGKRTIRGRSTVSTSAPASLIKGDWLDDPTTLHKDDRVYMISVWVEGDDGETMRHVAGRTYDFLRKVQESSNVFSVVHTVWRGDDEYKIKTRKLVHVRRCHLPDDCACDCPLFMSERKEHMNCSKQCTGVASAARSANGGLLNPTDRNVTKRDNAAMARSLKLHRGSKVTETDLT